jgi:hypothetical protein
MSLESDDFEDDSLATFWEFMDPLEDCSVTETGGEARIDLPSGTHDLWENTHTAPRIWQDTDDVDLDVTLELAALPGANTELGLIIAVSMTQYYRFGVYADGGSTRHFLVAFVNGGTGAVLDDVATAPTWLRVQRVGDDWGFYRSTDGNTWTLEYSETRALTITKVGIYGRNHGPAFTARAAGFTVAGDAGVLQGTAAATASASGTVAADAALAGSSLAAAAAAALLAGTAALGGSAEASVTPAASLRGRAELAGAATASAPASGTLTGNDPGRLEGSSSATVAASGTLRARAELAGTATAAAAASGTCSGQGSLAGTTTAASTAGGTLAAVASLAGAASCSVAASLVQAQLYGAASCSVVATGTVSTNFPFALAPAERRAPVPRVERTAKA